MANKASIVILLALLIPIPAVGQDLYSERMEATNKYPLEQAEENEEALGSAGSTEEEDIATLTQIIKQIVRARASLDSQGVARRDAHPKFHGCVKANFEIGKELPENLRTILFQPGKTYAAWIRFSNSTSIQNDIIPDSRGMAIKLMNVEGQTFVYPDSRTHDLMMITSPVFFVSNLKDYIELFRASAEGNPGKFFSAHPEELAVTKRMVNLKVGNPLEVQYFSSVPYRLGKQAIQFSSRPCQGLTEQELPDDPSPNFLKEAMKATLSKGPACFDFMVQIQIDPNAMPVENPLVEWDQNVSPFIPVAKITIDKQQFDTPEQNKFCRDIAFNPWNSLAEHEPLGIINRARRIVYSEISALRREINKVTPFEPKEKGR